MAALTDAVRDRLSSDGSAVTPSTVAAALRAEGGVIGDIELLRLTRRLSDDLAGAGPLQALMTPGVTDILVNAPDEVWVEDTVLRRVDVRFGSEEELRRLAQRLAAGAGRRLDSAVPYVDTHLPGGVRLHAVLPPISSGTRLSLRLPPARSFTVDGLVERGSLTPTGARLLRCLVRSRSAFLVTGGTGAGKTTLLSSLLALADPGERIVVAEDSPELRPDHPHVVRLRTRPANIEGSGEIGLDTLVRQALRMRPDRLVVGEARGAEVVSLMSALNTGHHGAGTLHANGARDVPARVEALACSAGLSRAAAHSQLAATRVVVVHLARGRRLSEVGVVCPTPSGPVEVRPAVVFTPEGACLEGAGADHLDAVVGASWRPGGSGS